MLVRVPMRRIRIVVLKRDADAVTEALGRLGVLELTRASEAAQVPAEPDAARERTERWAEVRSRLESLMEQLRVPRPEPLAAAARRLSLEEVVGLLDAIEAEILPVGSRLQKLHEQLREAEDTMEHIAPYRDLGVPPRRLAETSFLNVMAGDMPAAELEGARRDLPGDAVLVRVGPAGDAGKGPAAVLVRVLALSSRRSRFALRTVLEEHHFREQELPADVESSPAAIYEGARSRRDVLRAERQALEGPLLGLGRAHQDELREAWVSVSRELRISEAEQNYGATWATVIITGWCPRDRVEYVREAVTAATDGRALFEARDATREEIEAELVPSYTEMPRLLQPFQRLVRGFGEPGYREIEPTILFAASFLLMFGLVFGDLGHGLCLVVIGALTLRLARRPVARDVGHVISAAGLASSLFGAFFQGVLFGRPLREMGWGLSLGVEPIRLGAEGADPTGHVVRYLVIAVALGVVLVSLGVVLNIVVRLRSGDYEAGLLGRFGLVGALFYWGTLALAVKLAVAGSHPTDAWLVLLLVALPLVVLALHEPIYSLLTHRRRLWAEGSFVGLFEGALEVLETVMTYVANTFSFLRVAAFALAHVALCFTIFVLQKAVEHLPAGAIWSGMVFLAGTAVIIGLEGLIVAIQIFRLEYYEFFTKFFRGEGKGFHPFRLDEAEQSK